MQFTATKTFFSKELGSEYVEGLSYTARGEDTKLRALVPTWAKEGKVVIRRNGATVHGE